MILDKSKLLCIGPRKITFYYWFLQFDPCSKCFGLVKKYFGLVQKHFGSVERHFISLYNYFSPVQMKTRPKVPKIRLLKHHPTPSRFFWLFCVQIKIVGSNQKSPPQIFDIWCKNISFSPGFEFRLVSGGSREVSYSVHLHHFYFNFNLKNRASSKISSLQS